METMGTLRRTNYCGEVSLANAGQEMTVCGSIARARDKGGIIFADLRDTTGILQLVFDEDTPKDVFAKAESLKSEYVVICRGKLRERQTKNFTNPKTKVTSKLEPTAIPGFKASGRLKEKVGQ